MVRDKQSTASAIDLQLPSYIAFHFPPFTKDQYRDQILRLLEKRAASVHRPLTPDE